MKEARNVFLKARLQQFCKRTLRKQVTEYVPYTKRTAILEKYTPSEAEEKLYNDVSEYLQSDTLYALPNSQRKLMTIILRKLLASSSFAISGTLDSLITRLEKMLNGIDTELNLDDYDSLDQLFEESEVTTDEIKVDMFKERQAISAELEKLKVYAQLAKSIKINAKGENLLTALKKGFETEKRGGKRKAVIFTESRRTQEYLFNLLSNNGYADSIVFLNGSNTDKNSKRIYKRWLTYHKGEDKISGSRQADIKAAVVEEFKDAASILIGTEAAAEGINLQFCSLLVNYDLPWNPQRIEQRIGRCHRYGQKNDVVVVNFLNNKNEADKRVYELLDQKFKLFDGLFGSSDEVLGSESVVDFEKRIADIYQNCKTADQIKEAFDKIQDEYKDRIDATISHARQTLLENFDEEVSGLLKTRNQDTLKSVGQYEKWLYNFILCECNDKINTVDGTRLYYSGDDKFKGYYNLKWKDSEKRHEHFLRREHPFCQELMQRCLSRVLPPFGQVIFDYTNSGRIISYLKVLDSKSGWILVDKMKNNSLDEQEHILVTAVCDDGTELENEIIERIMELPAFSSAEIKGSIPSIILIKKKQLEEHTLKEIENSNKEFFLKECEKLDQWSEDKKDALQQNIKNLDKLIKEKNKEFSISTECTLEQMLNMKAEINKLKKLRDKKRRELYDEEDKIEQENEKLQAEMRQRIKGRTIVENIFTIRFEIV